VVFSFGIVTSIGLIAGSIADQQYWQRSFAIKRSDLKKSFVWGGLMFGVVPIALSVLGFIAANPAQGIALPEGTGLPMIGIATVVKLLPIWASVFFVVMLLAGLCSTLDSGLCAASSLYAVDMVKMSDGEREILRKERLGIALSESETATKGEMDKATMKRARTGMFGIAAVGLVTAFIAQHLFSLDRLWWIFNGVATCFVVPTVLSVFWDRLSAKGAFYGILASLVGMVVFVYGNWVQNDVITVVSAVAIVGVNLAFCVAMKRPTSQTDAEGSPPISAGDAVD
jgi:SSS family solute:Na+ symporter